MLSNPQGKAPEFVSCLILTAVYNGVLGWSVNSDRMLVECERTRGVEEVAYAYQGVCKNRHDVNFTDW